MLRGIYKEVNLLMTPTFKSSCFGLWRAIIKSIPHLLKCGKWSIGDGRDVDTLEDNWIDVRTCINNYVHSILDNFIGAKVRDLVTRSGE